MKLIVGLGNPGRIYAGSRHNIGYFVVKAFAKECKIPLKKESGASCLAGRSKFRGQNLILALPLTFMNLSGIAVSSLVKKYKIGPNNLLVVCDDLDLEFGRLKLKESGSSAGHRGIKSVIESLNTQDFCRLRVGIGRPAGNSDAAGYVLAPFGKKEKIQLKEIIGKAVDCCRVWAVKGINEAMNIFNGAIFL